MCERAGLDRALAAYFYDPRVRAFPLRHAWALTTLGHDGLKWAMLAVWLACLAWRPLRLGALYMALAGLAVGLLKHSSAWSCPWDLAEYGARALSESGAVAAPGRCSPAGHPIVGFALFGLYFALREDRPRAARGVLAAAWLIGLAAGAVQIARGAHFASHVLWTAWVAWAVTCAAHSLEKGLTPRD